MSTKLILGLTATAVIAASAACDSDVCRSRPINMLNAVQLINNDIQTLDNFNHEDLIQRLETDAFEMGAGRFKIKRAFKKVRKVVTKVAKNKLKDMAKNYAKGLIGAFEMAEEDVNSEAEAYEMGDVNMNVRKTAKLYLDTIRRDLIRRTKLHQLQTLQAFEMELEEADLEEEEEEDVDTEAFEMNRFKFKKALKKITKKAGKVAERYAKDYVRNLVGAFEMAEEDIDAGNFEVAEEDVDAYELNRPQFLTSLKNAIVKTGTAVKDLSVGFINKIEKAKKKMSRRWARKSKKKTKAPAVETQQAFEVSEEDVEVASNLAEVLDSKPRRRYTPRGYRNRSKRAQLINRLRRQTMLKEGAQ